MDHLSGQGNVTAVALLESFPQAALILDDHQHAISWNRQFLTTLSLDDNLEGRLNGKDLLAGIAPNTLSEQSEKYLADFILNIADAGRTTQLHIERTDGRLFEVSCRSMHADAPSKRQWWLVLFDDVTAEREEQTRTSWCLNHDELTALPNRRRFIGRLGDLLIRNDRHNDLAAVLYLDLDRFKAVNDTLGHPVGDCLLRSVAKRLQSVTRSEDMAARFSGDEFGVLLASLDDPTKAVSIAERLIDVVGRPYLVQGHAVTIGVSIGIAFVGIDGDQPEALIKAADLALYRAKQDGRNTYRVFKREMDHDMQRRRQLEEEMRAALPKREFELHFQPLFNLETNQITGFEALLRWRSPKLGLISPADFIPLAEEIGLIVPIGKWVLKTACKTAAGWPDDIAVAVNLSPAQFRSPTLISDVENALAAAALAPERLQLEITESVLMSDSEANLRVLHEFRALGTKLVMDDFGTGYSSLSYLHRFPFDKIKIDQSFVSDMPQNKDSAAIVGAISALGHSLGMRTTAEGVETAEQMRQVRADGCCEAQGYLISRPIPADQIDALLTDNEQNKSWKATCIENRESDPYAA